ncbi:MAG: 3-deoxy-manno-octulosonate cytidylyltransferase [Bacillota bacterium]
MKIVAVIPARYSSSRLPGKPLKDICGKPMIWWVYQQAKKVKKIDMAIVATDDERIENVCKSHDIPCIMTDKNHQNGSERLSEVASKIEADIYITIQGDEPLLEPSTIEAVLGVILPSEEVVCATLKTPFKDPVDVVNATTPKVVCDRNNDILLFSRAPIPYPKGMVGYTYYKPIGVYAFRRAALLQYGQLPMGDIEKIEEIELLRFLENGIKVRCGIVSSDTVAVDTQKDLERITKIIKEKKCLN